MAVCTVAHVGAISTSQRVVIVSAAQIVVAGATVEQVSALAAAQDVVAGLAKQSILAIAASELVVAVGAQNLARSSHCRREQVAPIGRVGGLGGFGASYAMATFVVRRRSTTSGESTLVKIGARICEPSGIGSSHERTARTSHQASNRESR